MAASSSSSRTPAYDFAIVGAGVVGSALAFSLARSGRTVALLERDLSHPDRIVGELLQPGGVKALRWLGLEDTLEGIDAVPVHGYQVFYGPRAVPIPYPQESGKYGGKGIKSTSGKVEGRSFHHGNFVQALRKRATAQQGVTTIEATVRDIIVKGDTICGVRATRKNAVSESSDGCNSEEEIEILASVTVVADGCFSKFRRSFGSSITPKVRSNFVGLELSHAPLPAPYHGHVVLSPSGPILLYQIGTEHTRILIDVAGDKLPSSSKGELQRQIREKFVPHLPEQLRPCVLSELDKGQRLRSMPNSFLPPSMQGQSKDHRGVIVVGDAMNMRHPLTGGGMSVGLWDCVHLARYLGGTERWWSASSGELQDLKDRDATPAAALRLDDWNGSVAPALRSWHWRRKSLSSVINILAQALYSLFGADDASLEVLREGCFRYFELGGECVGGPVSLLSGLEPSPVLLVDHFFRVALYSIWCLFTQDRWYPLEQRHRKASLIEWPGLVWRSVMVFYTACVVILPVIWTELRSNIPILSPPGAQTERQIASFLKWSVLVTCMGVVALSYFSSPSSDYSMTSSQSLHGDASDVLLSNTTRPRGPAAFIWDHIRGLSLSSSTSSSSAA
ncbi:unnamed protein product [Parajaminaea phylloscopi]